MRIVLTGSSGRVGRAIFSALAGEHHLTGIDRTPFSTTHVVGDFADAALLQQVLKGADAVIHAAALHAPHVGTVSDDEFKRVNVEGTRLIAEAAIKAGVGRLVFTSTTALYGHAIAPDRCSWIDETTTPEPKSIYHRTKLAAERLLEEIAGDRLEVRVLRMSRCFPEPADLMASCRLHRGIDVRDVADAHVAALTNAGPSFQRHIVSGQTPFYREDCQTLATRPASAVRLRMPELIQAFSLRGWQLPAAIDRVYASISAKTQLRWQPRYDFQEVLAQLDRRSLEVLPERSKISRTSE